LRFQAARTPFLCRTPPSCVRRVLASGHRRPLATRRTD
jgi:hypothetical protein